MFSDHYVVIAEDCVGSDDKEQHEASMFLMSHRFDVASSAQIVALWRAAGATASPGEIRAREEALSTTSARGSVPTVET
jgi:hypothetical protein